MPSKRFNFDPIPQPAAPARDRALTASTDGSRGLAKARLVPTNRLIPDPDQPRKSFAAEPLQDLAASLSTQGMRQPITAYYDDSRQQFVVISGERRLRAALMAGLAEVPVLLEHRPTSEGDKLVLQLAENLVREDLTPLEAATALQRLKELRPADWRDVAARHGINARRAYQLIELLDDPPEIRTAVERGTIREGHAAELRRAPADQQSQLLDTVVAHGLSVVDTRELIAGVRGATPPGGEARPLVASDQAGETPALPGKTRQPEPSPVGATPTPLEARRQVPSGQTAGAVAGAIEEGVAQQQRPPSTAAGVGAVIAEEKARRERTRRLRQRLENIARELRNMHMEEITAEYTMLPEIIVQARQARESLDGFIDLLERVQLDQAGAMDPAPH
ncbi:MAG TPA: ParB/RepB/Spo0J family partition protein [Chloroflexota bacterium]|nr:ParB/RepB/Spo0J family partition protein [Chloroflexota bacterium]